MGSNFAWRIVIRSDGRVILPRVGQRVRIDGHSRALARMQGKCTDGRVCIDGCVYETEGSVRRAEFTGEHGDGTGPTRMRLDIEADDGQTYHVDVPMLRPALERVSVQVAS